MDVFVARQPIFDREQTVYAYELLFRSGLDNFFKHSDQDQASSKVIIDSFVSIDMKEMTGGKKAFINFTRDLLLEEYATILPKDVVVVEILENVEPDEEIVAACQKLKQAGYTVAMDDFVSYEEKFEPLINLTDIIKIDFIEADAEDRKALVEMFQPRGIKLLAEKVETKEEFDQAAEMGYKCLDKIKFILFSAMLRS